MNWEPNTRERLANRAMIAARAMLAAALLLVLVTGSIVWPAAASGPLCAMACCAGKAPHAAGSCMHGSCETGVSTGTAANSNSQHSHHHHDQQQTSAAPTNNDVPQAFANAMASAMGSDLEQMPTIDAATSEVAPDNAEQVETQKTGTKISATALSNPCQPGCGASVVSFSSPGRSRNSAALPGSHHTPAQLVCRLANCKHSLTYKSSASGRQCDPRGPPFSFS